MKRILIEILAGKYLQMKSLRQFQNIEDVVFILWGKPAQQKEKLIDTSKHLVIKSPHPSPLSAFRGFFGSKPYSRTNDYLQSKGKAPINWCEG